MGTERKGETCREGKRGELRTDRQNTQESANIRCCIGLAVSVTQTECVCVRLRCPACTAHALCCLLWPVPLYIAFSKISSSSYSQTFPLRPNLRYLVSVLFSDISSPSKSQISGQRPILRHFLSVVISVISSASYSQTFTLSPNLRYLVSILFSNISSQS